VLILTRKKDEGIKMIVPPSDEPTEIEVVVTRVRQTTTRLGVDAPQKVRVVRSELAVDEEIGEAADEAATTQEPQ